VTKNLTASVNTLGTFDPLIRENTGPAQCCFCYRVIIDDILRETANHPINSISRWWVIDSLFSWATSNNGLLSDDDSPRFSRLAI
jgi:hypothetical protein